LQGLLWLLVAVEQQLLLFLSWTLLLLRMLQVLRVPQLLLLTFLSIELGVTQMVLGLGQGCWMQLLCLQPATQIV
jgi:hypothetical protein